MQLTILSSGEYHSSAFTFLSFNFLSNQTEPKKLKFQKKMREREETLEGEEAMTEVGSGSPSRMEIR